MQNNAKFRNIKLKNLLFFITALLGTFSLFGQSPHGDAFKMDCVKCHNPAGWSINYQTVQFDHDTTDYPLEGVHAQTDCKLCHTTLVFDEAPMDCVSCHTDVHSQAVGNDCVRCHNSDTWLVNDVAELHEENGFPLMGVHNNLSCVECHTSDSNLRFDRIGNDCISCHQDDFAATQNPNHETAGFSMDCTECHSPLGFGWDSQNISNINHDFFPLTQGHNIQDCAQCHTTDNYSDASPDCVSCHQEDYAATQNPNHTNSNFSTDCISCHTTNPGWSPADIGNHDFFPLTGGHNIEDCKACHVTDNYSDVSPDCISCHQEDFASTTDPNHQASGFSTDCVQCHTLDPGWSPANIDHDFFPLTQGHDIQDCTQCHTTGNYADASPDCVSCHQNDYNQINDPNHAASGFSTDCTQCHTTDPGWNADFNHDFFPLTQGHNIQDCTQCHTTANYADASPECVSCHQDDYNQTNDPNHAVSGFSTDCVSCHTTNPGWSPANINHDFFPLTQGHNIQDCSQCHTTGNYADASPECVSCHQDDYNQTNEPNHQAANFPTDCVACHTTNPGWKPAEFDHDGQYFPIYSGKHQGEWDDCVDCHANPNNYADFTCFTCHSRGETDDDHSEVNGYVYQSTACLQCHPDGDD